MNSVLLTPAYFLQLDPKQWRLAQPYAPLGTLFAAALLNKEGFDLKVFDPQLSEGPQVLDKVIAEKAPKYFVIYDDGFNYLTKMCLTNMREAAFTMIRKAKQKSCTVIVSNSDATDHYELYLNAGADFVIMGEAEQTLLILLKALEEGSNIQHIEGLAFLQNDVCIKTPPRAVMRDLDSLPLPAWEMIDLNPYREIWMKQSGYFSVNIATTRGCPYKCNWCAKPIYGNRYHSRSAAQVVEEIKKLKQQVVFEHIWFCDDIFGLKPGWVEQFAELVNKKQLRFRFKIQSRADLLVNEAYVAALAKAGCESVWMGAESGSQKILDAMDKGITIEQIETATALLKKYEIRPCFFIQFGYPGETRKDIRLTMQMINRLLPSEIGISVSYPLPGTKFHEQVKEQLLQKANWTDSDEMALMFRNTYPAAFYKQLHRYVHRSYRKHLAWNSTLQLLRRPMEMNWKKIRKAASGLYYLPASAMDAIRLKNLETETDGRA